MSEKFSFSSYFYWFQSHFLKFSPPYSKRPIEYSDFRENYLGRIATVNIETPYSLNSQTRGGLLAVTLPSGLEVNKAIYHLKNLWN
jgi:hypothetical protein